MAKAYDPSRLLCHASGGNFWEVGDIASAHFYPEPQFPYRDERFNGYIKVCGEMGGYGLVIPGHVHSPDKAHSYATTRNVEQLQNRYKESVQQLEYLRKQGISAGVYTQTTDSWNEVNGLLTYDREPKLDAAWLKEVNTSAFGQAEGW